MAMLRSPTHLLLAPRRAPGVAAFPEDADMRVAQKRPPTRFLERGMILATTHRTVTKQDFVVDKPTASALAVRASEVRFTPGEA